MYDCARAIWLRLKEPKSQKPTEIAKHTMTTTKKTKITEKKIETQKRKNKKKNMRTKATPVTFIETDTVIQWSGVRKN